MALVIFGWDPRSNGRVIFEALAIIYRMQAMGILQPFSKSNCIFFTIVS